MMMRLKREKYVCAAEGIGMFQVDVHCEGKCVLRFRAVLKKVMRLSSQ
jgi:hypothetical protein